MEKILVAIIFSICILNSAHFACVYSCVFLYFVCFIVFF